MRNIVTAFLLMLGVPMVAFAQTTPITMFYNPTGWTVASNYVFGSNGLPLDYNAAFDTATSSAANYVLQQNGSDNLFGPLSHAGQGNTQTWTETTTPLNWITTTIAFNAGIYSVNVADDASGLACMRNGIAAEYDIYMGPDTYNQGTNVVSAISTTYRAHPENVPFLNQLASLTVSGEAVLNSFSQPITPVTCTVDRSNMLYSYTLINRQMNQVIEYTLTIGHPCPQGTKYKGCISASQQTTAIWYTTAAGSYALTDYPISFNSGLSIVPTGGSPITSPLVTTGTVTFSALNLLPRIETLIQNNPYQLDTNIAHWQLGAWKFGSNIWGDIAVNSSWYGLNPVASCIRPNCS